MSRQLDVKLFWSAIRLMENESILFITGLVIFYFRRCGRHLAGTADHAVHDSGFVGVRKKLNEISSMAVSPPFFWTTAATMGAVSDHSISRQNHGYQCHVTESGLFIDVHTGGDLAENYGCHTHDLRRYFYP